MWETIVARPPRWLWSGVAIFGLVGGFLINLGWTEPTPSASGRVFFYLMGLGAVLFAVFFALYCGRERIEASQSGLRWRGAFHGWRRAAWSDVSDFYDARAAESKHDHSVVLFRDGRKLTFSQSQEGFLALRERIAQRTNREWTSRSRTGLAEPTSARASAGTIRFLAANFLVGVVAMGWMAFWMPGEKLIDAWREGRLDGWSWGMLAMMELVALPMFSLALLGFLQLVHSERPRTVSFDDKGFTVEEKGRTPWRSRWDEVTLVQKVWNGRIVETPHGKLYATTCLNHYRVLTEKLDENLPENLQKSRHEASSSVTELQGIRTFRYVSVSHRAILWLPIGIGLLPLCARLLYFSLGLEYRTDSSLSDSLSELAIFGLLFGAGVWGLWRMHAARIEVSDTGIAQIGLGGTVRLKWSEIESGRTLGSDALTWYEILGKGRRIRWWAGLPDIDELHKALEKPLRETPWPGSPLRPFTDTETPAI